MRDNKKLVIWMLMVIALVVFCGTVLGESMWGWISVYWLVVSAKWLLDYIDS